MPATYIDAHNITRHHGPRTVLDDVDLRVGEGSRIGLIGPNGSGKSTLLRILTGDETPDGGCVRRLGTVGYLPQFAGQDDPRSAREVALDRLGVVAASRELDHHAARLEAGELEAIDDHAEALERWIVLGADDAEPRLRAAADEVGLDPALLDRPLRSLSGGQAARVGLAVLRTSRFDAVLLDEPTNHLDADGLAVLRRFLAERWGGYVIVSHDRALLTDVAEEIVALDPRTGKATAGGGGYAVWERQREEEHRRQQADHEQAVATRAQLRDAVEETRRRAANSFKKAKTHRHDGDKHSAEWVRMRADGMKRRARIVAGRAERAEIPDKPHEEAPLRLHLTPAERRAASALTLEGAVLRRGDWSLGPLDLGVAYGERVLLAGANGTGKSTLLGALAGRVPLADGRRTAAAGTVIAELGQARDRLARDGRPTAIAVAALIAAGDDPDVGRAGEARSPVGAGTTADGRWTPTETRGGIVDRGSASVEVAEPPLPPTPDLAATVTDARTALATFGLGAEVVERPAATLSPGEQTRAELAVLAGRRTTCLLLDEPTNHLDVASLEALEAALAGWPGALVVASHDQRFREALEVTRTLTL